MLETSWSSFLIKKRNRKEVRHHGSFLSLYCVFNQRTVPFLRDAFYRKALSDEAIANASTGERVKLDKKQTDIDLDDGAKKNYAIFQDVLAKIK